jgi:uncharacterized DUF497 family protein
MKRLEVTPHALDRLAERGVKMEQIKETIDNPTSRETARPNAKTGKDRNKYIRKFEHKRLCVVAEEHNTKVVVITAYWK